MLWLNLVSLSLFPARARAATIRAEQPGPSIHPAAHLCPGLGGYPAGGTAANRHGVPHPATIIDC